MVEVRNKSLVQKSNRPSDKYVPGTRYVRISINLLAFEEYFEEKKGATKSYKLSEGVHRRVDSIVYNCLLY
jgi:hypothetical protein